MSSLDELLRGAVAVWVRASLERDRRHAKANGTPAPPFWHELLTALGEASGEETPSIAASGSADERLVSTTWISVLDASELLGVTPRRVRQLIENRQVLVKRVRRDWEIDQDSLSRRTG